MVRLWHNRSSRDLQLTRAFHSADLYDILKGIVPSPFTLSFRKRRHDSDLTLWLGCVKTCRAVRDTLFLKACGRLLMVAEYPK